MGDTIGAYEWWRELRDMRDRRAGLAATDAKEGAMPNDHHVTVRLTPQQLACAFAAVKRYEAARSGGEAGIPHRLMLIANTRVVLAEAIGERARRRLDDEDLPSP